MQLRDLQNGPAAKKRLQYLDRTVFVWRLFDQDAGIPRKLFFVLSILLSSLKASQRRESAEATKWNEHIKIGIRNAWLNQEGTG